MLESYHNCDYPSTASIAVTLTHLSYTSLCVFHCRSRSSWVSLCLGQVE